jgi:pre-rRNA-processing protein TSR1
MYRRTDGVLGRIARDASKAAASTSVAQLRLNRRNTAKQAQSKKRQSLISATRIFNGVDGAPRIVAVIPLTPDVDARGAVASLADSLQIPADDCPDLGIWKIKSVS